MAERLWVCHGCEMIGTKAEATAHRIARGHEVEELSQEVSDGVRAQQHDERMKRLVGSMMVGRMSRDG